MIAWTTRAILAVIAVSALRRRSALCRSRAMSRWTLSRNLFSFWRIAAWPARHKARRSGQGAPQAGIAVLRQLGVTPERARLLGGEIQSAELQELPVVPEAAQVPGLGEDGECGDRADAGNAAKEPIVGILGQKLVGHVFDRIALLDGATCLRDDEAKHVDRWRIEWDRQADRGPSGLV